MNGTQEIPSALCLKLSVLSKEYRLCRTGLRDRMKERCPDSDPLLQHVLKDDLSDLTELWKTKENCDVTLTVAGTLVPAHKCVLIAASDYFRAMFCSDFAEASLRDIALPNISQSGFENALGATYTGSLDITDANVLSILDTTDKLQIQEVRDCCEDFLTVGVNVDNCFELLQLSEKYTLAGLNTHIETFILDNFPAACHHSMFPLIPSDALITFLSNDELDYPEGCIFKGVLNWFKKNPSKDKMDALVDVMKHIRFTYMSSDLIRDRVLTEAVISQNPECLQMAQNALSYVTKYENDTYSRPLMEESNPEKPRGKLSVAVILPQPDDTHEKKLRQPALPQLFLFGTSPYGRINMSDINVFESQAEFAVFSMNVLQMGHSLFFLGAKQLDAERKTAKMVLLRFNVQTGEWTTLREPPFKALVVTVSVIYDTDIYVFGGATYMNTRWIPQHTFQAGCYKYSIPNNTWDTIKSYPHSVAHPAACVLGDEIYVVGGGGPTVESQERDKVNAYDPWNNSWVAKGSLRHGRSGHRVCSVGGKIYALGGRNPHKKDIPECEVYDPVEDRWTLLSGAPVPQPVASYNLLVHGDSIILLGGGDETDVHHTTVQTFNTTTQTWSTYNWKDDQSHFIPMGSIHNLPLVRARMSCLITSEYTPHEPMVPGSEAVGQGDGWTSGDDDSFFSDESDEAMAGEAGYGDDNDYDIDAQEDEFDVIDDDAGGDYDDDDD